MGSLNEIEILNLIELGEDSKTQFKENIHSPDSLAQEMVAFSNASGGKILIGVQDDGKIKDLTMKDIQRLNQMVSNVSSNKIEPPINPLTETIKINKKKIMVVEIKKGINKPYCTNKGIYLTKAGADKRKISQEELQRLFQDSNKIYADEMSVMGTSIKDMDTINFKRVYERIYQESVEENNLSLQQLLNNLDLMSDENLTLAGLLLFGEKPQARRPLFMIKAVSFFGNDPAGTEYRDEEEIRGTILEQYKGGKSFLLRNLKKIQTKPSFNSEGTPEIPKIVIEELLVNALIHRNYYINSPIRLFIFDNRVEILSPGKLPNTLTVEKIKYGLSVARNPVLNSFAAKILPYRGIGTGILRAYKAFPDIEFENNVEMDQFKAIIYRVRTDVNI